MHAHIHTLLPSIRSGNRKKQFKDPNFALILGMLILGLFQRWPSFVQQVFSSWMHFCAVRVFSESILRYGLPPSFLSVVLSPSVKSEKKVCFILEGLCSSSNGTYWETVDEGGMGSFAGDTDAHPYVSFTINLI